MIRQRKMILVRIGMMTLLVLLLLFYLEEEKNVSSHTMTNSIETEAMKVPEAANVFVVKDETETTQNTIDNRKELEWNLQLVNSESPVAEDYQCELVDLNNRKKIDKRCYDELQKMLDDCSEAGMYPLICSAYRSYERQEELFEEKVKEYERKGYTRNDAEIEAEKSVLRPGASEHQLGLAVDIVSVSNQVLDERQENTPTQKWLMDNSWKYGFVLRYPTGKMGITGVIYEPWHYRYVGQEAAKEMYEQGLCLEEYIANINQ